MEMHRAAAILRDEPGPDAAGGAALLPSGGHGHCAVVRIHLEKP